MPTILRGDRVRGVPSPGWPYYGAEGVVEDVRKDGSGQTEYKVVFPRRSYTPEDIARGEDKDPFENIHWLLSNEVELVGVQKFP